MENKEDQTLDDVNTQENSPEEVTELDEEMKDEDNQPNDSEEGSDDPGTPGNDEEGSDDSGTPESEQSEDEELVVTIGDEEPEQSEDGNNAPEWVRNIRKQNRQLKKELRDLKKQSESSNDSKPKVELGKKPTLEDHEYDNAKYEDALDSWYQRKIEVDKQNEKLKTEQELLESQWQNTLKDFNNKKEKLKSKAVDYDEAEFNIQESLSASQQGMIVQGAIDPAVVFYALGKNPTKLKEIAEIKDPVKFSFEVSRLETQMKVQGRKKPVVKPEKIVKSSAPGNGMDATLDELRKTAEKTGDYTKVIQYKRSKKGMKNE